MSCVSESPILVIQASCITASQESTSEEGHKKTGMGVCVLNKGEDQADVRKLYVIFNVNTFAAHGSTVASEMDEFWPSVLHIPSFTPCSVCSEQQCIAVMNLEIKHT